MEYELTAQETRDLRIGVTKAFLISVLASTALGGAIGIVSDLYESESLRYSKAAYDNADHAYLESQKNLSRAGETVGEKCRLIIAPDHLDGGIFEDVSDETSVYYILKEPGQPCGSTPLNVQKNFFTYKNASDEVIKTKKERKQTKSLYIRDQKSEPTNEINKYLKIFSLIGLGIGVLSGAYYRSGKLYDIRQANSKIMRSKKLDEFYETNGYDVRITAQRKLKQQRLELQPLSSIDDPNPLSDEEINRIVNTSGELK